MSFHVDPHPAATIFPLMDGVELVALADDIRAHGLLEPIVLLDGFVLDGRNRLRACELADVDPRFETWTTGETWDPNGMTPTEWVVSHNLHRRHLTTGQRAALALDLLPRLEDEAKHRQGTRTDLRPEADGSSERGRADEKAAALVGVGRTTVADAKAIQKRDATGEIVDAMRAGEMNVSQAARSVGLTGRGNRSGGINVLETGERDSGGKVLPIYFGKGDKWDEATVPLARYLAAWEKRGYRFGHVNPRNAKKRLAVIDNLIDGLQAAREDLEPRSHEARRLGSK